MKSGTLTGALLALACTFSASAWAQDAVAVVAAAPDGIVVIDNATGSVHVVESGDWVFEGQSVFSNIDRGVQLLLADRSTIQLVPASGVRIDDFESAGPDGLASLGVTPLVGRVDLRLTDRLVATVGINDLTLTVSDGSANVLVVPDSGIDNNAATDQTSDGTGLALVGGDERGGVSSRHLPKIAQAPDFENGDRKTHGLDMAVFILADLVVLSESGDIFRTDEAPGDESPDGPNPADLSPLEHFLRFRNDGEIDIWDGPRDATQGPEFGNIDVRNLFGNPEASQADTEFFVSAVQSVVLKTPPESDANGNLTFSADGLPDGAAVVGGLVIVDGVILGSVAGSSGFEIRTDPPDAAEPLPGETAEDDRDNPLEPTTGPEGSAFENTELAIDGGTAYYPTIHRPAVGSSYITGLLGSDPATEAQQQAADQSAADEARDVANMTGGGGGGAATMGDLQAIGAGSINASAAGVTSGGLSFDWSLNLNYATRIVSGSVTGIQTIGEAAPPFRRIDGSVSYAAANAADPADFQFNTTLNCAACTADLSFVDANSVAVDVNALGNTGTFNADLN